MSTPESRAGEEEMKTSCGAVRRPRLTAAVTNICPRVHARVPPEDPLLPDLGACLHFSHSSSWLLSRQARDL